MDILGEIPETRAKETVMPELVRELNLGDLGLAGREDENGKAPTVMALRESHHQLARLLARGLRPAEISAISGYSTSRISQLQDNPAFQELLGYYRDLENSVFADMAGQVAAFGADVLAELRDRLEANPANFKNRELLDVLDSMLDRSGFGRSTKVQAEVVHVTGEQLKQLKQLAKEARQGNVTSIELIPTVAGTPASIPQEGSGTEVGRVIEFSPKADKASAEGKQSKGNDLREENP